MSTFIFPGQGSQQKGMGKDLFDAFPELTLKASEIMGFDMKELCLLDPKNVLAQTQFTQPALYLVNALSYFKRIETNYTLEYCAGHSLGEFNALLAAGAFDFETGMRLVKKRGEAIAKAQNGGMAAVIGVSGDKIREVMAQNHLDQIDVANYNTKFQTVISGNKDQIKFAKAIFEGTPGVKMFMPLNVSGAFHSRFMKEAKEEFAEFLKSFSFNKLKCPVIANLTARPYPDGVVHQYLTDQLVNPVKWEESVRYLMGVGQDKFEELGYGRVLTEMVARITKESEPLREEAGISPGTLGSAEFKRDYKIKYAYLSGSMFRGTASKELVVKMGKAGLMGFLGTGGMGLDWIEKDIQFIQSQLKSGESYGMNLLCNLHDPEMELRTVELYMKYGIKHLEASAYMDLTLALAKYRVKGLKRNTDGTIFAENKILAKISKLATADLFMSPIPERILKKLMDQGHITIDECVLAKNIPMCDDIIVEADSGGHTDMGNLNVILPSIIRHKNSLMKKYGYHKVIRVGAAGGISTPESAAAAFMLGADFILTGSINQCTVEAGTSDLVKDILQSAGPSDTDYCPAGDMFEIGAKVQVLKKGIFFPARARKLFDLYSNFNSLDEIDEKTIKNIEENFFRKSIPEIWNETVEFFKVRDPRQLEKAEKNPKVKMALVFRWYFGMSSRVAFQGDESRKVDFQIHCGPSLGAFNEWVKGTDLENWRNRHVDVLAEHLMKETARFLTGRINSLVK